MTGADFVALLPLLVVALTALGGMLLVGIVRHYTGIVLLTVLGMGLTILSLPIASIVLPRRVTPLLMMDAFALLYIGLMAAGTVAVAGFSYGYLHRRGGEREEYYLLLALATLGAAVLAAANHFASFFLGLELLSVSLYALIAYGRMHRPLEAGIKYLVLSAASSAFLLFGMALIYFRFGSLAFGRLATLVVEAGGVSAAFLIGLGLILAGVGFKLGLVPFHMWTPDVYQGAPAPVTGFLATVSKGAMVALLLRYFFAVDGYRFPSVTLVLGLIAVASMFIGNLLALLQTNVKRLLAYSSIAHLGYLLVAFLAGGTMAVEAVTFYLVAYFVTTLGAFGTITVLSGPEQEAESLETFEGLFWRRPWVASSFALMLLSLAGIPLTAGFLAKFYAIAAGVDAALWTLVILLAVNSVIGIFYYLRVVFTLFAIPSSGVTAASSLEEAVPGSGGTVLAVLTGLLLWLGVYPAPVIDLIHRMSATLL